MTALQAWLALANLLLEPATRGRYDLDGARTSALMRLRRLLPEVGCFKGHCHAGVLALTLQIDGQFGDCSYVCFIGGLQHNAM